MTKKHLKLGFLLFLASSSAFSGGLNYKIAFNLDTEFQENAELLNKLACKENIFGDGFRAPKTTIWQRIKKLNPFCQRKTKTSVSREEALKRFQEDCLSRLTAEKRRANLQPVRNSLTYLGVSLMMHQIMNNVFKSADPTAAGFANMSLAYNMSSVIKDLVESGYNVLFPKDDSLDVLAEKFIKNMPYIPRKFWPKIVNKFIIARDISDAYTDATNFIEFALGLQVYRDKPKIEAANLDEIIKELNSRIDTFFESYNNAIATFNLGSLKTSIKKFITSLFDPSCEQPRYQYLVGPGGIGKTQFVEQLSSWINELIPNAIYFSNASINSPEDLEGSPNKPGLYLNTLRNQLVANKAGSIVFIDEYNPNALIGHAKKTFNGNMAKISTKYFGYEIDGDGIKLEIPPTLIFVASNDEIADDALANRFNIIKFWSPKKSALVDYAEKLAHESKIVKASEKDIQELRKEVLNGNYSNFRAIQELVEPFIYDLQNNPKPAAKTNQLDFDVSDELIPLRLEPAGCLES